MSDPAADSLHSIAPELEVSSESASGEMPTGSESHEMLDESSTGVGSLEGEAANEPLLNETLLNETLLDEPLVEVASTDSPPLDRLSLCELRIGYEFRDKSLLRGALTHASGAEHRLASNERLEFLGDAVLGLVICEALYHRYPQYLEGGLTRVKSVVVSRQTCAKVSALLGLEECLIMGKGMSTSAVPQSLLADVFESLIAAMYLDGGLTVAADFIRKYLGPEILAAVSGTSGDNYKSQLQQLTQRKFGSTPSYQLLDEKGPDHSKCFKVVARAGTHDFTPAWGRNKKEAEQRAACNALALLNGEAPPFPAE